MECEAFVVKLDCGNCGTCKECVIPNNRVFCNNCDTYCNSCSSSGTTMEYHEFELVPLEEKHGNFIKRRICSPSPVRIRPSWKGPLKAIRLLIVVALLPALFIAVPIYLRYFVFSGQMYPVGMSDMRLIDKKVSTTWCQKQVLHSNGMFNAFLLSSQPKIASNLVPVSMTRHLMLEDDMKEYWGFYLLQGSIVTVSTCVRWPGASLIMIRGHKHLQECAYIGDDSSEELDEILRANGGLLNDTIRKLTASESPANKPEDMIRQLGNIKFHEPRHRDGTQNNHTRTSSKLSEEKDTLDPLFKQTKHKTRTAQMHHKNIVNVPDLVNRYRDTNINEDEEKNIHFRDLEKNNTQTSQENIKMKSKTDASKSKIKGNLLDVLKEDEKEGVMSSVEIFDDIYGKLTKLGSRGLAVLNRLNDKLVTNDDGNITSNTNTTASYHAEGLKLENAHEDTADKKLNALKHLLSEIIEEQNAKKIGKRSWKDNSKRRKRDIVLSPALLEDLNEEDEKGNTAIEDGFEPDGIADHHSVINETTPNDMSRSEFWSSFSSSEEALLECDGLILNLPLTPHKECSSALDASYEKASLANTITYKVPVNGYYFFVFNSENEIQTNYIRVKFDLQKTIYDLSNQTMECKNSTSDCSMPLSFFSTEKVVLEVPISDNDSMWNEEFVVMSECEPRTSIYLVCVISVPILILIVAFQ